MSRRYRKKRKPGTVPEEVVALAIQDMSICCTKHFQDFRFRTEVTRAFISLSTMIQNDYSISELAVPREFSKAER